MDKKTHAIIDDILGEERRGDTPISVKNERGIYVFANEAWSELAEATVHAITSKRDDQLPWGAVSTPFIQYLDNEAKRLGRFNSMDRRPQFRGQFWARYTTEKIFAPDDGIIVSTVEPSTTDAFCQLASRVNETGIALGKFSLSVKQLYLLHQLLFHIPHKQTAREFGCSTNRIQQYFEELREKFEADDSKELMCSLSAHGLFPLLEHLHLLFRHQWISPDLIH